MIDEKIYKADAKQIVDMLFNTKVFREDITRDGIDGVEDLIAFLLSSRFESYQRAEKLFEKITTTPTN